MLPAQTSDLHVVLGEPLGLAPTGALEEIFFAGGCFWGVERIFWQTTGVVATAVGYMGGRTPSPSYMQVSSGLTGHAETVRVIYDTKVVSTEELAAIFFENHDPTQVNRQGGDIGTQYRSAIWTTTDRQAEVVAQVKAAYQRKLAAEGFGAIATVVHTPPAPTFYLAEDFHQGYLHENPTGYCNHGFNGVQCPRGVLN